jgi:hypothetical protein
MACVGSLGAWMAYDHHENRLRALADLLADPSTTQARVTRTSRLNDPAMTRIVLWRPATIARVDTVYRHTGLVHGLLIADTTWTPRREASLPLSALQRIASALDTSSLASASRSRQALAALTVTHHTVTGTAQ